MFQESVTETEHQSADLKNLLAGLRIDVSLELGAVEICMEDLLDLSPGQVFHYDFDPGRPITLFAGGEEIAQGFLVVDGERVLLEIASVKAGRRKEETFSASERNDQ